MLHTATWTGREMVVIGGASNRTLTVAAAAYNPALRLWRVLPSSSTPFLGGDSIRLWNGGEGFQLNPETDQWTRLPDPPFAPRHENAAVRIGSELIAWGRRELSRRPAIWGDGARY